MLVLVMLTQFGAGDPVNDLASLRGPGDGFTAVDDERLLAAIRDGNDDAFAAMVERYHRSLLRVAMSMVHDPLGAEDVVQETWLGFIESLSRFEGKASVRTWLFRILLNCLRARYRRERRSLSFSEAGIEGDGSPLVDQRRFRQEGERWTGHWADPPEAWPEAHALQDEVMRVVQRAVERLPIHQRVVVTLRDIEGWTCPEVCALLRITEANQRVLLHRARSKVRTEIEIYMTDDREGTARDATSR